MDKPQRWTRRRFLKYGFWGSSALCATGTAYSVWEAGWLEVNRSLVSISGLPAEFDGFTIALITDVHHSAWTGLDYIRTALDRVRELAPDVVVYGGDYVTRGKKYIEPCIAQLGQLRAPFGTFAVLGNHDHWTDADATRSAMCEAEIKDLTNTGVWLTRGAAWLRLGGVGDLWADKQDLTAALGDAKNGDACLLLSHNPDYAERIRDTRVKLVLSGHTHGGQVQVPVWGPPIVPSKYGQKYAAGLVQAPCTQVFVSRGLGTITPPVRFHCRPEVNLLTLRYSQ